MKVLVSLTEEQVRRLDRLVGQRKKTDPGESRSRMIREAIDAYRLYDRSGTEEGREYGWEGIER